MSAPRITADMLRARHACKDQLKVFAREWPRGAPITLKAARRAIDLGLDLSWLATLMTAPTRRAYVKATAPTLRAYVKATAPARRAFDEAIASARRAYVKATASALRAYVKAIASATRVFNKATARDRRAYHEAIAGPLVEALIASRSER